MRKKNLLSKVMLLLGLTLTGAGSVSAAVQEGKIVFGTNNVKIDAANVTADDNLGNSWTIATVGTTSFTTNAAYYQVGSGNKPATSITFTTTLSEEVTITSFEAKFGGFNGTAGTISLTLDGTEVTSGKLNATTDVTVGGTIANTKAKELKVSITGISKGVKAYYISYKYDNSAKQGATITAKDVEMEVTEESNDFYTTNSTGAVTFTTNNSSVAVVEAGVLKAVGVGTATITISQAEDEYYAATEKTFNVNVKTKEAVTPVGGDAGNGYVLVTNVSELTDGDEIIIGGTNASGAYYVMGEKRTNNYGAVSVTVSDGFISSLPATATTMTLVANGNHWNFKIGEKYLSAASSSSNYIKLADTVDKDTTASISISSNSATIIFQGSCTRNTVRFNYSNNPPLFSCYESGKSTGNAPVIFKKVESTTIPVTIGDAEWRTLVSAKAYNVPEGLKAYIVSDRTAGGVTFTEVTTVANGEPVILNGPAGDYELELTEEEVTANAGNLLQVSTSTTGNGVYVLANKTNGVGFYKWTGGALGAGRVYLPAESASGAREFLAIIDVESTGIERVETAGTLRIYDLQGRRVSQPTKGLYIVNGKKTIIK